MSLRKITFHFFSYFILAILFGFCLTPQTLAFSFSDDFTNADDTALTTHNPNYSQVDGPATPLILSNKAGVDPNDTLGYWVVSYPVNLTTIKVCAEAINALETLGFQTSIGNVQAIVSSPTGSSPAKLYIGDTLYTSTDTFDNSGTHNYCIEYNGANIKLLRDNISVISQEITSIGTITSVRFAAHNYTGYGWTNPVSTIDNLSIDDSPPSAPTPTPTEFSFDDQFTAANNTSLESYNVKYSKVDGPSIPIILDNQAAVDSSDTLGYWVVKYPVLMTTINTCVDATNALETLGFQTALGGVRAIVSSPTGSSPATLYVGSQSYSSTNTFDNSGTHRYCLEYDGSNVSLRRDNVVIITHALSSIGTISSIRFAAHNYEGYGWTNPISRVDNLSITGLSLLSPNNAPEIAPISDATLDEGDTYSTNGSFTDSDSASWSATVDYGDGSGVQPLTLAGMNFTLNHQYTSVGTYTVTVSITDNQGATGTETATITVNEPDPVTTTFNSSADTYVRSGQGNQNEGAGQFMKVQSSGDNRSLLRFDQAALQAAIGTGTVLAAKLRLTITTNGNGWGTTGRTVAVHRLIANWAEGNGTESDRGTGSGATWNCAIDSAIQNQAKDCAGATEWEMGQPNNPSVHPWAITATATQTITNNQTGVVEYDVTADVASFVAGTNTNYGWLIKKTNEGQTGQVSFGTKESNAVPQLVVTYQP